MMKNPSIITIEPYATSGRNGKTTHLLNCALNCVREEARSNNESD
jgi:hypothetical protein